MRIKKKKNENIALAGNRTRVNCLEGNYANHYTTNALPHPCVNNYADKTLPYLLMPFLSAFKWYDNIHLYKCGHVCLSAFANICKTKEFK